MYITLISFKLYSRDCKKKMDSVRFMASSLSNLVNDLADLIYKIKFNEDMIK